MIRKNCETCGEPFNAYTRKVIYCSVNCRKIAYAKKSWLNGNHVAKCPICGNEFKPLRRSSIYCSNRCSKKAEARGMTTPKERPVKLTPEEQAKIEQAKKALGEFYDTGYGL